MDFKRKPEITDAIKSLRPTSTFSLVDDDYSTLVWNDSENDKPTKKQVEDKLAELTTQYEDKEYQQKRVAEYPSIEEQLDDIYHLSLIHI